MVATVPAQTEGPPRGGWFRLRPSQEARREHLACAEPSLGCPPLLSMPLLGMLARFHPLFWHFLTRETVSSTNTRSPKGRTHERRTTFSTSETSGRKEGSWSQQYCTNVHNSSVRVGCVGRCGRSPPIIANVVAADGLLPNGTAPVNT